VNLLELCGRRAVLEVYVHGLLGRRGERPEAGARYIGDMEAECARRGVGRVVSVIGRHWALDREEHWDRVQKAYDMLVFGKGTLAREE
jgi:2,3-bisphosphoglycerate-independent phosphoglycerate mutase